MDVSFRDSRDLGRFQEGFQVGDVTMHTPVANQAQEMDTPTADFLCVFEGLQEDGLGVEGSGLYGLVDGHNALEQQGMSHDNIEQCTNGWNRNQGLWAVRQSVPQGKCLQG